MKKKQEWKEKKTSLGNAIILSVVLTVCGFIVGLNFESVWSNFSPFLGGKVVTKHSLDWTSLDEVYEKLSSSYDGALDSPALIEGAKKGLVEAIGDVYTVYMDAEESKDFNDSLHGNVGSGIGVEMGLRDGYVRVLRTLPNNPARAAGILAGDIIYKVNGEEVYSLPVDEISSKIRGETGTEVTVTVVRGGEEKEFTMRRETINNASAYVEYEGQTAIVTVTRFDNDTGTMVRGFVREFEGKNINKVILDLRNNGGGYVSAAKDLIGLWIDGDTYLVQKSLHGSDHAEKTDRGAAKLSNMKTIVLVNGSTASASEITAGALQDYQKATIVGEKTYGKGVVQNLYSLSHSAGATLKVTTASWYTPKGRSINKEGITPDVTVERTYDDINMMRDPQLDAAKNL